jgi:hypothetical protein
MEDREASAERSHGCLRVLIWGAGVLLALVIIVVVVAGIFARRANSDVAAEIARMKTAGEPTSVADLAPAKIADSENGAVDILAAEKEIAASPAEDIKWLEKLDLSGDEAPVAAADVERARELLTRLAPSLNRVHMGLARPHIIFPLDYTVVTNSLPVPDLTPIRQLARLLSKEACIAALDGKGGEAAVRVADIYGLGDALNDQPAYITQLVAVALQSISRSTAEYAIVRTQVPPGALRELARHFAGAPEERRKGFVAALTGERAHLMSLSDELSAGNMGILTGGPAKSMSGRSTNPFARFWARSDEKVYLGIFRGWIASLDATRMTYPVRPWATPRVPTYKLLSMMLVSSGAYQRIPGTLTSSAAYMRTAAVGLEVAARIEEGALAPADLSSFDKDTSTDPFTAKPLLVKNDGTTWTVYSVGENLKDDGGAPAEPRGANSRRAKSDDIAFRVPLKGSEAAK